MSPWVPRLVLAIVGAGIVAAIISISVGEGGPQGRELDGIQETQRLLGGIRQDGARLGAPDAPVEIELFTDLRATTATEFQAEVVDPLIEEYVRTERARINLRHFSFGRTAVTEPAIAANAAGNQGRGWQYAALCLRNLDQAGAGGLDESFLSEIAEVVPDLEKEEWEQDFESELERQREDPDYESPVDADGELAFELKLPAAPAIIVTGPGGSERLIDTPSLDEVRAAIERVAVTG